MTRVETKVKRFSLYHGLAYDVETLPHGCKRYHIHCTSEAQHNDLMKSSGEYFLPDERFGLWTGMIGDGYLTNNDICVMSKGDFDKLDKIASKLNLGFMWYQRGLDEINRRFNLR